MFNIVLIFLLIKCNYGCKLEVLLLYKINCFFSHRVSTGKKMRKIKMIIKPLKKKTKPKMNRISLWVLNSLLSTFIAVPLPIMEYSAPSRATHLSPTQVLTSEPNFYTFTLYHIQKHSLIFFILYRYSCML